MSISCCNTMDCWSDFVFSLTYEKVNMIRHQTIGIETTARWKALPSIINRINHIPQNSQKADIVLTFLKDFLPVSASHHDVIDTGSTYFS